MRTLLMLAGLVAATSAGAAAPQVRDGMLVDEHGMTLYIFSGEGTPDAKSCEGDCERNFPPALAAPGDQPSGPLTVTAAQGGGLQWAFEGKPLYRGLMDRKPGDHSGDGLNEVWHSVRPR
ncbi:COG4315 family predicted lipoprotein [Caballeronia glebae]|jgi:predicted lipoprotein with Yx(FWY)xxD motif|uniref:COG4315 family predicted lipoprotein n=1 Tax=Caballeronia glebae TaxID=1777143 RepID=UPI0038B7C290